MLKSPTFVLLALAFAPVLRSQTTIDYQVTPGAGSKNNGGTLIGESFTASATAQLLTSLDVYINKNALTTGNFTLSLYAVSGTASHYSPSGSALFSSTYSNSILSSTAGTSYLFDNLNWSVTSGATYMVAFESSVSPSVKWQSALFSTEASDLIVGTTGQNRYANNAVVTGSYYAMTLTTSAIPEPSTYAALAGAGSFALAIYRRRKRPFGVN